MAFGALFSICFLKKKLKKFHWVGLALNICALAVVGTASVFDPATSHQSGTVVSTGYQILGIGLIVLGQAVQAAQFVVEEKLMADMSAPPLLIVGMEGVWGFLLMIPLLAIVDRTHAPALKPQCVVQTTTLAQHCLPGGYKVGCAHGLDGSNGTAVNVLDSSSASHLYHEETSATLAMLSNSPVIQATVVVYIFAILGLNVAGMNVTRLMSAVTRTVFEACRTLCIWIFALFLYYAVEWHGEAWTDWSWMQAGGFLLLVAGTFVYNELITLPCLRVDEDEDADGGYKPLADDVEEN